MCGICGNVALSKLASPGAAHLRVRAMLLSLSHRGPDAIGQQDTESAVLGATRLAIRGLTDQINQPITDAGSGVIAVCNGEIDNHHELAQWLAQRGRPVRQATDVAVIPGLYLELGEAFASRLVGAFAIALWDPRKQLLLLARDREALGRYARFGYFASPDTPFTNIRKVPPGGIVRIDASGIRHSRYWRWNN